MAKYKQADRRRQIILFILLARRVDFCNRLRQRSTSGLRYFPQPAPEFVFKTDARATASNNNRVLDDWEFHDEAVRPIATFNPSAKE